MSKAKNIPIVLLFGLFFNVNAQKSDCGQSAHIFQFQEGVQTRWVSFENPTGAKGQGGRRNKGAKGAAMNVLEAGETRTIPPPVCRPFKRKMFAFIIACALNKYVLT